MKNIILILFTITSLFCDAQRGSSFHYPYFMNRIKDCTGDVRPSIMNDKRFYWGITDRKTNISSFLKENGCIQEEIMDSTILSELTLYKEAPLSIEYYVGNDESIYIIYVDCSIESSAIVSHKYEIYKHRMWKHQLIGRYQRMRRNYRYFYLTKEKGEYIAYLFVPYGQDGYDMLKNKKNFKIKEYLTKND